MVQTLLDQKSLSGLEKMDKSKRETCVQADSLQLSKKVRILKVQDGREIPWSLTLCDDGQRPDHKTRSRPFLEIRESGLGTSDSWLALDQLFVNCQPSHFGEMVRLRSGPFFSELD